MARVPKKYRKHSRNTKQFNNNKHIKQPLLCGQSTGWLVNCHAILSASGAGRSYLKNTWH